MAETFEIRLADETLKVPAWATEETMKSMAKFSEISAKSLNELLKLQAQNNKVVNENKELFKTVKGHVNQGQKTLEKTTTSLDKSVKSMDMSLDKATRNLQKASDSFIGSFEKYDLKGMGTAIGSLAAMSGPVGLFMGMLENYTKSIIDLSHTGAGFSETLVELKNRATLAGVNLTDFAQIVSGNGQALRALADNTNEGAAAFARLSKEVRFNAREFNNFGLSNSELNQIMAEEINLRRLSGMEQSKIFGSVAGSMNNLLTETSALASITGADRRDLLRARQEAIADPVVATAGLSERAMSNIGTLRGVFDQLGPLGEELGRAITMQSVTGRSYQTFGDANMGVFGGTEFASQITDIANFVSRNRDALDPQQFQATLVTMVAELGDSISEEQKNQLRIMSDQTPQAGMILQLISELGGLSSNFDENLGNLQQNQTDMQRAGVLGLPSATEETVNLITNSVIKSMFDLVGVGIEQPGKELAAQIRAVGDLFYDPLTMETNNLAEAFQKSITDIDSFSDAVRAGTVSLVALGLAIIPILGALKIGKGILNIGRTVAGAGAGAGAAAASTAKTAATSTAAKQGSGALSKLFRFVPKLLAGVAGGAVINALTPSELGDGTLSEDAILNMLTPEERRMRMQANGMAPAFETLSPERQADMRLNTPGSRGMIDQMRAAGQIDPETHAILTGQFNSYFERMVRAAERQAEETRRLRQDLNEQ